MPHLFAAAAGKSLQQDNGRGMQIIFLGLAAELLLVSWIMIKNLNKGEAPQKKKKSTGGFESLT